jgi:hypothetical protein
LQGDERATNDELELCSDDHIILVVTDDGVGA